MNANDILKALERKHEKDVFIPECKTGPTWFNKNLRIMDVWVLKRSWVNLETICYEIKINRGDFKQDNKWKEYLDYCHKFYFVCPWGMIKPEEIENGAGLYWVTKNGNRIYVKKYAKKRDIEIPIELLLHIIMSRTVVMRPHEIYQLRHENERLEGRIKILKKQLWGGRRGKTMQRRD